MATDLQTNVPNLDVPKAQVRVDYYQTESIVSVSIYLKNQKKDEVTVEFSEESLSVQAKLPDGTDYVKEIPLAGKINPDLSVWIVRSTKIEISLKKLEGGIWSSLEVKEVPQEFRPTYPSSSICKTDWDKLNKELEDDYSYGDDALANIYETADDDTKKAMIKSMQESGGTVLNTNWEEVKKERVEFYKSST